MRFPVILMMAAWGAVFACLPAAAGGKPSDVKKLLNDPARTFTIDVQNVPLDDVLRMLSKQHDLSIITAKDVETMVSARFHKVTLAEALDSLVTINGYAYRVKGTVVEVYTPRPGEDAKVETAEVHVFELQFANAETLKGLVEPFLSEGTGKMEADLGGNKLIVYDRPAAMTTIREVIERVDQPEPQVTIGAEIIEAATDAGEKLGINWQMRVAATGSARPITWPFDARKSHNQYIPANDPSGGGGDDDDGFGPSQSFPYAAAEDFTFGTLDATGLRQVLELLESDSNTNLIANPEITTLNNHEAKINLGSTVPVPTFTTNLETGVTAVTGFDEVETGTILSVIPQVNERAGVVKLTVKPEISEILGFKGQFDERPIVGSRKAETTVRLKDGETLVIGGLVSERTEQEINKVPLLGDVPVLGWLFRWKSDTKQKSSLYIFVTPRIMSTERYRARATAAAKRIWRDGLREYEGGGDDLRTSPADSPFQRAKDEIDDEATQAEPPAED